MGLSEKKVLVTGGAGFIGSHLCEELLNSGAEVFAVDNLFTGKTENVASFSDHQKFKFINADVNDYPAIAKVFEEFKPDYVFHYAAILGVKRVIEEPLLVLDDIAGFKNILELSKINGVKKVIFSSSSEAYGNMAELPLREDMGREIEHQTHSTSLYALVKVIGEKMMKVYNDKYGLPTVSLRFFNVFGPRQESSAYGFVVGVFINQIIADTNPTIFGDGYQTRDFIFIKDNIRMAIKTLFTDEVNGQVINIGVGRQTTILDLAEKLIKISGKNLIAQFLPARPYEIKYRSPDVSKMHKLLGEKIEDKFEEHLKTTYDSYQKK
jgi:nucleoside-diphosphate-sugar epimerase